jgi:hypothetical protein
MRTRKIESVNHNGYIVPNELDVNSISFHIDLPKSAVVDHIRIKGDFKSVNGEVFENVLLEDIPAAIPVYHKEYACKVNTGNGKQRVAGTVYFLRENYPDLLEKVEHGIICDFEVYYHEEFVAEVE